jgi:cation:H+ antiporter
VLERRESYALLAAYGLFVAWAVAETVGVTSVLKGV